jgi:hypothetical protein
VTSMASSPMTGGGVTTMVAETMVLHSSHHSHSGGADTRTAGSPRPIARSSLLLLTRGMRAGSHGTNVH